MLCYLGGATNLQKDVEEPFPADQVESFGEVDEGKVEGFFFALCTYPVVDGGRRSEWPRLTMLVHVFFLFYGHVWPCFDLFPDHD